LIFYITVTEMEQLPSYGENVIVLILGDEFYRVPKYAHKVAAIFKCYGTRQVHQQFALYGPALQVSYLKLLMLGQFLRNLIYRLPAKISYRLRKTSRVLFGKGKVTPIYDIPPGYFNSEDLEIKPIAERAHAVFFDGSVIQHRYPIWSLRYWTKTPKALCRKQMVLHLQRFKQQHPEFEVKLSTTFEFAAQSSGAEPTSYSQNMMNTKVCLVPRGTTLESYRFFEAMRYGCVIITEVLPPRWFYEGAPVLQIGSWQNLEPVLKKLLDNERLLEDLHQRTLAWWETRCSEQAIGQYIAEKVSVVLFAQSFFQGSKSHSSVRRWHRRLRAQT
jgi:hypothetical protein